METIAVIVWLIIVFFIGRWLFKTYFTEPIKDIKAGLYKFDKFKPALADFKVELNPIKGNENTLGYREHITNGVEGSFIGHFEYSINDYIQNRGGEKLHNYYFEVKAKIKETYIVEKSNNYVDEADFFTCKEQITKLREKIIKNKSFIKAYKENHLKGDFKDLYKKPNEFTGNYSTNNIEKLFPYKMPFGLFSKIRFMTLDEAWEKGLIDDIGDDEGDMFCHWEEYDIYYVIVQGYKILIPQEALNDVNPEKDFGKWSFYSDHNIEQCMIL